MKPQEALNHIGESVAVEMLVQRTTRITWAS